MFEIYKACKGRRTYIVSKRDYRPTLEYAKKYFKCSEEHVMCVVGYVYRGELYFEDPKKKNTRACWVAYYKG
ncbi:MAG: hypothetical protein K5779_00885 [Saccharofermentans sp.]|nr:hypothetical protein [Saccharofermentans sp.]